MTNLKMLFIIVMLMMTLSVHSNEGIEVPLWQNEMPGNNGDPSDIPSLKIFFPDKVKPSHRMILILPGGEYDKLNIKNEGYRWVPFLNRMGIAAAVLKYRLPNGNRDVPVADVERAMQILRANAKEWNVNDGGLGIMGFSAGGHLASYMSTHYNNELKPDFQILFYPIITMMDGFACNKVRTAFLGTSPKKKVSRKYSCDMHVTRITPRAIIMLSDNDTVVAPSNGVNYYNELYRHDVPASLYVFPSGGHGWGADESFEHHIEMELLLKGWLESF